VKHWQETVEILSIAAVAAKGGRPAPVAVATVVRISGSAYRRPGAKLLVREDGGMSGSVSGGCLEADVREHALGVARAAAPKLLHYETGSDDRAPFGLGLGCNGAVDVFVQPMATPAFQEMVRHLSAPLEGEQAVAVAMPVEGPAAGRSIVLVAGGRAEGSTGDAALDRRLPEHAADRLARGESSLDVIEGVKVFTEVLVPPPHLVVFGAGDDAIPLVRYALDAGFRVALVDHRPAYLEASRFPAAARRIPLRPEAPDAAERLPLGRDTLALVKTHSLEKDREWTRRLLASEVAYVGVLGPRARVEEILRQLSAKADGRVFGPVGLDLGAEGPEQVGMSVVAELLAVRAGRSPRHLREKDGPIHAR